MSMGIAAAHQARDHAAMPTAAIERTARPLGASVAHSCPVHRRFRMNRGHNHDDTVLGGLVQRVKESCGIFPNITAGPRK